MSDGDATQGYTGVDTLEVMEEALNYNAFLRGLVTSCAKPRDRILDFGAGSGMMARPLAAAGYDVSCVEPDDRLRASLSAGGLDAAASLNAVPDASIDLIYTINVLEHIVDDRGAVAALRDRLKPGGRLVAYVPAFPILYTSLDRKVGHVRRYRRAGLTALLTGAGFTVERVAYQDSLGFPAALLFKALDDGTGAINRTALVAYDRLAFPLSRVLDRACGRWFGKNLLAVARR